MNKFMIVQRKKIEIDKWCEGCDSQNDPGKQFVLEWIAKNASGFRQAWEKSWCRSCQSYQDCGYNVLEECVSYKKMNY